jgi:hypothetical protein
VNPNAVNKPNTRFDNFFFEQSLLIKLWEIWLRNREQTKEFKVMLAFFLCAIRLLTIVCNANQVHRRHAYPQHIIYARKNVQSSLFRFSLTVKCWRAIMEGVLQQTSPKWSSKCGMWDRSLFRTLNEVWLSLRPLHESHNQRKNLSRHPYRIIPKLQKKM